MSADVLNRGKRREEVSPGWYKLDNAALIYPAIKSRKWSSVFRLSVMLKRPVDPELLQQALDTVLRRFPTFAVTMRAGLFWHYFEHGGQRPAVQQDVADPCVRMFASPGRASLIRVRYFGRRIALEVFHSVTDGYGGILFLKTLTAEYLKLCGYAIPPACGVMDCSEPPRVEEIEDSFARHANLKVLASRKEQRAYHLPGTDLPPHSVNIVSGHIPVDRVLAEARKRGVSLTEYLAAVYLFTLYNVQKGEGRRRQRPIKLSIPVNMRRFYGSTTLRNFSSYVNVSVDPRYGEYVFEEIVTLVHHYLRYEMTEKHLNARLASNVKAERNPLLRVTPLPIKNFALAMVFEFVGEALFTSTMSNMGAVEVPDEMKPHVEYFDAMLGPPKYNKVTCAMASYEGLLIINFTRTIQEAFVEREFFSFLVRQGIPVKISSNQE